MKEVEGIMDWIEVYLERLSTRTDRYLAKAENAINYNNKNKYVDKANAEVTRSISANTSAIAKYQAQAEAVADKLGLSDFGRKQAREGMLDTQQLDEETKKKIDVYKEWYDKIEDCKDAIEELKQQQKELMQQKLDNVVKAYESKVNTFSAKIDALGAQNEYRKEAGYSQNKGSVYYKTLNQQKNLQQKQTKYLFNEYKKYQQQLSKAKSTFGTKSTQYWDAYSQLTEIQQAYFDSKKAVEEFTNEMYEATEAVKQYQVDRWGRASNKLSAAMDLKKKRGETVNEADYTEQIKVNAKQIEALDALKKDKQKKMAEFATNSPKFQEMAEEVADLDVAILNLAGDNEDLKDSIREYRWKGFNDEISDYEYQLKEIEDARKLLDTDNLTDENGNLTAQGQADILLAAKGMELNKQRIANYQEALKKLQEELDNGVISQDEYTEYSREAMDVIRESALAVEDYKDQIFDLYTKKMTEENDLLQENIDKRKEALEETKNYYDYMKKIKSHNKDINALKAQIAALEGTTNAAAQARLAKLREELSNKEDDLNDTVKDHEYEMRISGYDKMSKDADKALDDTLKALKNNAKKQQEVVDSMLNSVKESYKTAYGEVNKVIESTGITISKTLKDALDSLGADGIGGILDAIKNGSKPSDTSKDTSTGGIDTTPGNSKPSVDNAYDNNDTAHDAGKDIDRVTSVKVTPASTYVEVGKTVKLTATVSPSTAANKSVTWTSSNPAVASVSSNGVVKGLKPDSEAKIIATSADASGKTGTCTVKIRSTTFMTLKEKKGGANTGVSETNKFLKTMGYGALNQDERISLAKDLGMTGVDASNFASRKNDAELTKRLQLYFVKSLKNNMADENRSSDEINKLNALPKYFSTKYKKVVTGSDLVNIAQILGVSVPGSYGSWTADQKAKVLAALKGIGYSSGGIVTSKRIIPPELLGQIAKSNNDDGYISIQRQEAVLTKDTTQTLLNAIPIMQSMTDSVNALKSLDPSCFPQNSTNNTITFNWGDTNISAQGKDDFARMLKQHENIIVSSVTSVLKKEMKKMS